jgi:hypothetical protein
VILQDGENNRSKSAWANFSVSDLQSSSLAGYCRLIRSNLCTRHILNKLTPRGHHYWPDKAKSRPSGFQNAGAFIGTNPRKCSERFRNQRIGVLRPSGSRRLDWQTLGGLPFLIAATVTSRAPVPFSSPTPELSGLRGLLGGPRQDRSEWLMRNTEQNGAALSCRSGRRIGSRFFVQFVQSRQPVQRRNSCGNSGANVYCRHLDGRRN